MFPHVPLQAITLDLADTRSISQTVEHILNNAIYIPENDATAATPNIPLTPATPTPATPTTSLAGSREEAQSLQANVDEEEREEGGEGEREEGGEGEGEEGGEQSGLRRRRQVSERDKSKDDSQRDSESISSVHVRDNQSRGLPHDEGGNEEDVMSFSSLQRRKRELLANAKR